MVDVAESAGVSQAFLSQIENGASASLFTHHRIAAALDTTLQALLNRAESPPLSVRRRDEGEWLKLIDGMEIRSLVGGPGHMIEANETVASPGATTTDEPFAHDGQEMVIVLEGTVTFFVGDDDPIEIGPGDVIGYPATTPHSYRVTSDQPARFIVVNSPGGLQIGRESRVRDSAQH
jgi:quercetin dioxygenase-like cupin family protein